MSIAGAFLEKARIFPKGETDCWIWQGSTSAGYGSFRSKPAHRWAYELFVGPIPEGLHIDHLCHVKRCVNPAHLEAVTQQENNRRARTYRAEMRRAMR